jgi:hypothetical protein
MPKIMATSAPLEERRGRRSSVWLLSGPGASVEVFALECGPRVREWTSVAK